MNRRYEKVKLIEQMPQPNDQETENAVLATMMRYNEKYDEYSDMLSEDLFYDNIRKAVYKAVVGLIADKRITDMNSLSDYSASNDLGYKIQSEDIKQIFPYCSPATFKQDVERLILLSKRRKLWTQLMITANKVQDRSEDFGSAVEELKDSIENIQSESAEKKPATFEEAVDGLDEIVENNIRGIHNYLKTGFWVFDNFYLLRPDTLTIIAAFTSVGKSSLAMNLAVNVAKQGIGVAYYSLEMGKEELAARVIGSLSGISSKEIMNCKLEGEALAKYKQALPKARQLPIYIDDAATITFERTVRSIRNMTKLYDIKLVVIDYLQIYDQTQGSEESALAAMSREGKNIAKELQIPVIMLSQLNRNGEHPSMRMLRGSGQIAENADNILLIDRPEADPSTNLSYTGSMKDKPTHNTAVFTLAKGRGVGNVVRLMGFEPRYTQFYDLDENGNVMQAPQPDEGDMPF